MWEFRNAHLGVLGQKNHLDVAPVERCKLYYKGEGGGFPQVQPVMSFVSLSCSWFILTPKVLQLCTNHLVLILCRFVWIVEACQFFLIPSQNSSTTLYPYKVLWARECAPTFFSSVVSSLDSHLSPSRSWERVKIFPTLTTLWSIHVLAYNKVHYFMSQP